LEDITREAQEEKDKQRSARLGSQALYLSKIAIEQLVRIEKDALYREEVLAVATLIVSASVTVVLVETFPETMAIETI